MHVSKNEPTRISVAEAALTLGVDVRTIHRMIRRGQLRGNKVHEGLRAPFLVDKRDVVSISAARETA
ncbi:helix-turn-helix domain-containing protein [Rhodococcus sp. MALMAid1271]|uniref:helix-turn-helix domain-containing protein n=1 Tax=Rhodococcus sp. MALMAid1271 TaxID=3411744 RepID=UPI003BA39C74